MNLWYNKDNYLHYIIYYSIILLSKYKKVVAGIATINDYINSFYSYF